MQIILADDLEKVPKIICELSTITIQRMPEGYLIDKDESGLTTDLIIAVIVNFETYKPIQVINLQPVEHQLDVDWVKEGF